MRNRAFQIPAFAAESTRKWHVNQYAGGRTQEGGPLKAGIVVAGTEAISGARIVCGTDIGGGALTHPRDEAMGSESGLSILSKGIQQLGHSASRIVVMSLH